MKILFLTDSLSLPRNTQTERVEYEHTYPYLLKKKFPKHDFVFVGVGGGTISNLFNQSLYYTAFNPDLVFLQSGIVDCAPRPFRKIEKKIINELRIRFLFAPFVKFLAKNRNYKYTSIKRFNYFSQHLKKLFNDSEIYSIGILPASAKYEKKLPGITKSIAEYNEILKQNFNYIDNSNFPEDGILSDFHHLNDKGHKIIFDKVSEIVGSIVNQKTD